MKKTGYDQFFQKARDNAKPQSASSTRKHAELLRRNLKLKNKKQKKSQPWALISFCMIGITATVFAISEHDKIDQLVGQFEISLFGKALAEGATKSEPVSENKKTDSEEASGSEKTEVTKNTKEQAEQKKRDFTEEELNHFAKLNERKRELDAKEEELARMEAELTKQKAEIETRMAAVESTRKQISNVLEDKVKIDDQKVETLVQLYSNMKPPQAAKVFEEMDEDLAVEIFGRMKKKNAAEIMNLIKPEKAKLFTEKFAGYKRDSR